MKRIQPALNPPGPGIGLPTQTRAPVRVGVGPFWRMLARLLGDLTWHAR